VIFPSPKSANFVQISLAKNPEIQPPDPPPQSPCKLTPYNIGTLSIHSD